MSATCLYPRCGQPAGLECSTCGEPVCMGHDGKHSYMTHPLPDGVAVADSASTTGIKGLSPLAGAESQRKRAGDDRHAAGPRGTGKRGRKA